MESRPAIDVDKLKADIIAYVDRTPGMTERKFSKLVTGTRHSNLYRDLIEKGQDKRISAKVLMGVSQVIGRNPLDYVIGMHPELTLPSAAVLMNTFSLLLDSLGIDPLEDGRAQKLASQFPNVLRSTLALHEQTLSAGNSPPSAGAPAGDEDQPPA